MPNGYACKHCNKVDRHADNKFCGICGADKPRVCNSGKGSGKGPNQGSGKGKGKGKGSKPAPTPSAKEDGWTTAAGSKRAQRRQSAAEAADFEKVAKARGWLPPGTAPTCAQKSRAEVVVLGDEGGDDDILIPSDTEQAIGQINQARKEIEDLNKTPQSVRDKMLAPSFDEELQRLQRVVDDAQELKRRALPTALQLKNKGSYVDRLRKQLEAQRSGIVEVEQQMAELEDDLATKRENLQQKTDQLSVAEAELLDLQARAGSDAPSPLASPPAAVQAPAHAGWKSTAEVDQQIAEVRAEFAAHADAVLAAELARVQAATYAECEARFAQIQADMDTTADEATAEQEVAADSKSPPDAKRACTTVRSGICKVRKDFQAKSKEASDSSKYTGRFSALSAKRT